MGRCDATPVEGSGPFTPGPLPCSNISIDLHAVLAARFGHVECTVGGGHKLSRGHVRSQNRASDADRNVQVRWDRRSGLGSVALDLLADALRGLGCVAGPASRSQDGELIAAATDAHVKDSHRPPQDLREASQDRIAGQMADYLLTGKLTTPSTSRRQSRAPPLAITRLFHRHGLVS